MPGRKTLPEAREIGRRLRAFRIDLDLSAPEMAKRLGMSPGNYGHYEAGRNRLGAIDLPRFAEALGVSTQALTDRLRLTKPPESREETASPPDQTVQSARHRFYEFIRKYPRLERSLAFLQIAELTEEDVDGLIWLIEKVVADSEARKTTRNDENERD